MSVYTHWSSIELKLVRKMDYSLKEVEREYFKPSGLWFDVDYDWKRWCDANDFRPEGLAFAYDVQFNPGQVLQLSSAADLDFFTTAYSLPDINPISSIYLDWPKVQKEYAGIVIAPYLWECRMERRYFWYYGWDCASGCIWDLSIITKFERIELPVVLPEKEEESA